MLAMLGRSLPIALLSALVITGFAPRVSGELSAAPAAEELAARDLHRGRLIVRVYREDPSKMTALSEYDLLEFRDRTEGYVLVAVDDRELDRLRIDGFRVEIDPRRTIDFNRIHERLPDQTSGIDGFPCYRTVEETYAGMGKLAASRSWLATWTDVGDSWERVELDGGYDLRVLRLTNSRVPGPKPKLFLTCSIHAREYAPGELCTRFAERMFNEYGSDADVTWVLDHHEIHVVMLANPDGRKQAENGLSWRKNTNQDYCSPTSINRGADLNRNFDFQWGCCGGASNSQCNTLYRGPSPASEPETQAYQEYLRARFEDRRGDQQLSDPAPLDTTGIYIDIHSFGQLVLWPWGFTGPTGNATEFTTLGRRVAWFNGYEPDQITGLTTADGSTADFGYGELGVASLAFEIGTVFFEECDYFEDILLEINLDALFYTAKVLRAPYVLPAGPEAFDALAAPGEVAPGTAVTITGTVDEDRFNQTNGTEPTQNIAAAEYYVDTPPWETGAVPFPMAPADGAFDTKTEEVTASVDTTSLAPGRHIVFVRGQDADGDWGPVGAAFFDVTYIPGTVAGTLRESGSATPLGGKVHVDALDVSTQSDPVTGAYSLSLPPGSWELRVTVPNHYDARIAIGVSAGTTTPLDADLEATLPVLLVDDDDDTPAVRDDYTAVLDSLGRSYVVWDASAGDPPASTLDDHDAVIWFSGADTGGGAGPGPSAESSLDGWLQSSRCLMIASQDYYSDRGETAFMRDTLGFDHGRVDVAEESISGIGMVFGSVGNFSLAPPYVNRSDSVSPKLDVGLGFLGDSADSAISHDAGAYRATWLGFGVEGIPQGAQRDGTLREFLAWCDALPAIDGDGDSFANRDDCAPGDAGAWEAPGPAKELVVAPASLSWSAPTNPGGTDLVYDVLRSADASDFSTPACPADATTDLSTPESFEPASGEVAFYLVRSRNACASNLGESSQGTPRTAGACP